MAQLTKRQDAFGQALYDHMMGRAPVAVIERDDGYIDPMCDLSGYFSPYADWPAHQRKAISLACGPVLDVGCGAGRVAVHLHREGLDVVGIDNSPMAVEVCKMRGFNNARVLTASEISRDLGVFNTIVMYGNNFGLVGSPEGAKAFLRQAAAMTGPAARILAETLDPVGTSDSVHLAYHQRNRQHGRLPGQIRIRVRYRDLATPYFDWMFVTRDELRQIVDGTDWQIARLCDNQGALYVAVLEKEPPS